MMLNRRITAIFNDHDHAEAAFNDLRRQGVSENNLSVITHHKHASKGAAMAAGAGEGVLAGGAVGAVFGLAASLIPGVGPFITAGWLATALGAAGGAAAAGAIVGGSAGLVAGALARAGYNKDEAEFLGAEIEEGRTLLAVDTGAAISDDAVLMIIAQHGGRTYSPGM